MKRIMRSRPSPAILVAVAALVAAVAGTALAAPTANTSSVQKTAKKALKKAKKASEAADEAQATADAATPLFAVVRADGSLARGQSATASTHLATGLYQVDFDRDLSQCAWVSQIGSPDTTPVASGEVSTSLRAVGDTDSLLMIVNNSAGAVADKPFHVIVHC